VEFRRTAGGRQLMARVYQPQGAGPFPDDARSARWGLAPQGPLRRGADGPRDRGERCTGGGHRPDAVGEAPYPASVQDANYGVRWLKSRAQGGTAIRRRSASTAAPAAATSPSCWHAAARRALQRDTASFRSEHRCDGGLRCHALANQRPVRALPAGGENEARGDDGRTTGFTSIRGRPSTKAIHSGYWSAASRSRWCHS
jgi:hypothetical protein